MRRALVIEEIQVEPVARPAATIRPKDYAPEVARKSRALLGYEGVLSLEERTERAAQPLAAVLRKLGVRQYRRESVEDYKRRVVEASRRRFDAQYKHAKFLHALMSGGSEIYWETGTAGMLSLVGSLVSFTGLVWLVGHCLGFKWQGSLTELGAFLLVGGGVLALVADNFVPLSEVYQRLRWRRFMDNNPVRRIALTAEIDAEAEKAPLLVWREVPLQQFRLAQPPEEVIKLAIVVKEACPEVSFTVHYTDVEKIPTLGTITEDLRRRALDPFLEVHLGKERYFIAVWDQEDFQLTAE